MYTVILESLVVDVTQGRKYEREKLIRGMNGRYIQIFVDCESGQGRN